MAVYSRADWGSTSGPGGNQIAGPVAEAYIHHYNSGITPCRTVPDAKARMRGAQAYHRDTQGWGDIGYSWCVDDIGNIYEGRGWWRTGAHTYGYNSKGYGICWLGDSRFALPSGAALRAIAGTIQAGIAAGAISPNPTIVAHRDRVPDTSCCGDPMYAQLPDIRALTLGGTVTGDDEMNESQEAKLDQVLWATNAQYPPYGRAVSHPDMIDAVAANGRRLDALAAQVAALQAKVGTGGGTPAPVVSAEDIARAIIAQLKGA
jgi:N-acetylmuramoyl-L-alanine amidase